MSEPSRDQIGRPKFPGELRFFGTITASISHEINNVLAMVNELSGLFADSLMLAQKKGRPLDPERLSGIVERISVQVQRGKEIVTGLNNFAHGVDHSVASLDLREILEQINALCQRFARLRRTELIAHPADSTVHLQGNKFVLQHVLYRCIELCLETSSEEDRIIIEFEQQGDEVELLFTGGSGAELAEEAARMQGSLGDQARSLGGSARVLAGEGQPLTVTLRLPTHMDGTNDPSSPHPE